MSFLRPYRAVLRMPHARAAFASSLVGRLTFGIVSLSLLLTLTAGGRGYGTAGLVMALFSVAIVLTSPFRARLLDQHGPRAALPPMAAGYALSLVVIALIPDHAGASLAVIAALATMAGACAPPLGIVMRTLWSALVEDRSALQAAYSLDGVVEELLYVIGPVIVGVIALTARPAIGLLVSAGLAVLGTGLFLRALRARDQGRPQPVPQARPTMDKPAAPDGSGASDDKPTASGYESTAPGDKPTAPGDKPTAPGDEPTAPDDPRASRAILALALLTGVIGLLLGGLGLVLVAFSQARHDPAAVAWIEAGLSAGAAVGGLGYGTVTWRTPARRRLVLLAAGLAAVLSLAGLSPNLPVLSVLAALAGVAVSPALATAYVLADSLAAPQARNRAGNWVNSGYNAGNSAGALLSGQLIGRVPLAACLPLLAAPALLAIAPLAVAPLLPKRPAWPARPPRSPEGVDR